MLTLYVDFVVDNIFKKVFIYDRQHYEKQVYCIEPYSEDFFLLSRFADQFYY